MERIITHENETREALKRGIDLAGRVKSTLGPAGRNTGIGQNFLSPEVTNDGKSSLDVLWSKNETEQFAIDLAKDVASEMFDESEDGTTTAITLLQAFNDVGYKATEVNPVTGGNPDVMKVRKEMVAAGEEICVELDKMARPISTHEEMKQVAFVSVEDEDNAEIIASVFDKVGKDGVVTVEEGFAKVEAEVVEGIEIEAGLLDERLANDGDRFVLSNPLILVTNEPLNSIGQISHITKLVSGNKHEHLVILGDNFGKDLVNYFVLSKVMYNFTVVPVKTPFFGKAEQLRDLAIALGADFYDKDTSPLKDTATEGKTVVLGVADSITITKDRTVILGAKGNIADRVEVIQQLLNSSDNQFDKKQLEKRMARISGKVGVIRVGADSKKERDYLMKKIKNGVGATKNALKEGVVKGGGTALMDIAAKLPDNMLAEAIKAPYKQIAKNMGVSSFEVPDTILDPVKTEKTAVRIAASVASLVLTIDTVSVPKYEKPKDVQNQSIDN